MTSENFKGICKILNSNPIFIIFLKKIIKKKSLADGSFRILEQVWNNNFVASILFVVEASTFLIKKSIHLIVVIEIKTRFMMHIL